MSQKIAENRGARILAPGCILKLAVSGVGLFGPDQGVGVLATPLAEKEMLEVRGKAGGAAGPENLYNIHRSQSHVGACVSKIYSEVNFLF